MDITSGIFIFIFYVLLMGILPILNGVYIWRLFNKYWQKVVFGFGLGLLTPFFNFMILYILYFAFFPVIMEGAPLGGATNAKFDIIHSTTTLMACGSFTLVLYILVRMNKLKK